MLPQANCDPSVQLQSKFCVTLFSFPRLVSICFFSCDSSLQRGLKRLWLHVSAGRLVTHSKAKWTKWLNPLQHSAPQCVITAIRGADSGTNKDEWAVWVTTPHTHKCWHNADTQTFAPLGFLLWQNNYQACMCGALYDTVFKSRSAKIELGLNKK